MIITKITRANRSAEILAKLWPDHPAPDEFYTVYVCETDETIFEVSERYLINNHISAEEYFRRVIKSYRADKIFDKIMTFVSILVQR